MPRLQHSFTAVAVQGLGYFWIQSLCHETLTLPHAANSLAILTMLHIGVMGSLLGSSYLCVSGLKKSRKDKTRHPGTRHLQRLEGTQTEDPHFFLPSFCSPFPSLSPPFIPFICFLPMHSFYPLSGQITREGNLSRRLLSLAYSFLIFLCFQRDHSQTHFMPLEKTRIF